jgi:hypothetical protein
MRPIPLGEVDRLPRDTLGLSLVVLLCGTFDFLVRIEEFLGRGDGRNVPVYDFVYPIGRLSNDAEHARIGGRVDVTVG